MSTPRLVAVAVAFLFLWFPQNVAAQIYADVTVSGGVSGTFTITLAHAERPNTVANFVGLATGKKGWIDRLTGAIRYDSFYQGVTFHRVIAGFVSQSGSRSGDGTDGPGYKFRDELVPVLNHENYAVAMANSGKNTNGSQFYICKGAQPNLNGGYTVFGLVTAGQAVCDAINAVPTTNERPNTPIVINAINVHGPSLATFDLAPAGLPKLQNAQPVFKKAGAFYTLGFDRVAHSDYLGFHSGEFSTWVKSITGYLGALPGTGDLDVTASATGAQRFFRLARIDYSTCALADRAGNTFQFPTLLGGGTAALNAAKTDGNWTYTAGGTSAIVQASLSPQPFTAQLYFRLANGTEALLNLAYNTTTAGTYAGQALVTGGTVQNASGSFTIAP